MQGDAYRDKKSVTTLSQDANLKETTSALCDPEKVTLCPNNDIHMLLNCFLWSPSGDMSGEELLS